MIRRFNTGKLSTLAKSIDSIQSQPKFQQGFLQKLTNQNAKHLKQSKQLWKKNKARKPTLPAFKAYSIVILKTWSYWHKVRQTYQWSRVENPEIDSHIYGYLIFDKCTKLDQWKKDSLFNK